jgi:hypothetical protein
MSAGGGPAGSGIPYYPAVVSIMAMITLVAT